MSASEKNELEFDFVLLETDTCHKDLKVQHCQLTKEEKLQVPSQLFPFGVPELQISTKDEIRKAILDSADKLSIHSSLHNNKQIPRKTNFTSLYCHEPCPLPTTIQVDRDPVTGELTGYHEEVVDLQYSTAQNSCSFTRQPNEPSESLRGTTTNFPFWPGGMDVPDLDELLAEADTEEDLFNVSEYLTCPPGLEKGVCFASEEDKEKSDGKSQDIDEMLAQFNIYDVDDLPEEIVEDTSETSLMLTKEEDEFASSLDEMFPLNSEKSKQAKEKKTAATTVVEQWAHQVDVSTSVDDFHQRIPDMAHKWPFELDIFQKQAVLHLENHESVFVAAHTSAGKTVVAEYAIALSAKHMTKVIYTSPIKALSNQKFRDFKKTFGDVGLVTGDVQINSKAFCLIMTTEILRSMLYNGSDVIRDLEWVIFDEVHYINDAERGVVWEEVLIMLPDRCNVILLSATTPNTMEFANWVGKIKKKNIFVISTLKRPVPLVHHLYTGNSNKTSNEMFVILDSNKKFQMSGYRAAVKAKEERQTKHSKSFGAKHHRGGASAAYEKGVWLSLIARLKKHDQLPVVAFTLSRRRCDDNAMSLTTIDLTTTHEKSAITLFFDKCVKRLKGNDRDLPQVKQMESLLLRGLGIHHSGILPILKEVVEMLFARGLVKLLFATETFAMGVNMPARSVVFDRLRKHDGTNMRNLLPGEYIQMAGRAGRRGLDANGNVIILVQGDVPEVSELHTMMLGRPSKLQSKFRLTYSMILNLLRVEQLRVEEVMKRSFSEFNNRKDSKLQEERLQCLQEKIESLSEVAEMLKTGDYRQYIESCTDLIELRRNVMRHALSQASNKQVHVGRVVLLNHPKYVNHLAVILKISTNEKKGGGNIYTCLVTVEEFQQDPDEDDEKNKSWDPMMVLGKRIFVPSTKTKEVVIDLVADDISQVCRKTLKFDANRIIRDYERRQIPRFRDDPPDQETSVTSQELLRVAESTLDSESLTAASPDSSDSFFLDFKKDFGINKMETVEEIIRIRSLESSLQSGVFNCVQLTMFEKQVKEAANYMEIEKELDQIRYLLSEESLQLLPEYQQRVNVLKKLKYIDGSGAVQLKGRVACEISNHELVLTELVFENILSHLEPSEIVALLSSTVFQQKVDSDQSEAELPSAIKQGIEEIRACCRKIGETQWELGLNQPVDEFVNLLNFGIVEVVYEWAKGTSFKDITNLTEVQEGVIVRTIQRLNEICRDVRNAARVIGDPTLYSKMEKCSEIIKRDIVFAASLYTQ